MLNQEKFPMYIAQLPNRYKTKVVVQKVDPIRVDTSLIRILHEIKAYLLC